MQLLSIFNNGSGLWVLVLIMIIWAIVFGRKAYLNYVGGWKKMKDGKYSEGERLPLYQDGYFILLVLGELAMLAFLIWINSDYK